MHFPSIPIWVYLQPGKHNLLSFSCQNWWESVFRKPGLLRSRMVKGKERCPTKLDVTWNSKGGQHILGEAHKKHPCFVCGLTNTKKLQTCTNKSTVLCVLPPGAASTDCGFEQSRWKGPISSQDWCGKCRKLYGQAVRTEQLRIQVAVRASKRRQAEATRWNRFPVLPCGLKSMCKARGLDKAGTEQKLSVIVHLAPQS